MRQIHLPNYYVFPICYCGFRGFTNLLCLYMTDGIRQLCITQLPHTAHRSETSGYHGWPAPQVSGALNSITLSLEIILDFCFTLMYMIVNCIKIINLFYPSLTEFDSFFSYCLFWTLFLTLFFLWFLRKVSLAIKGVGSQGDGTVQVSTHMQLLSLLLYNDLFSFLV